MMPIAWVYVYSFMIMFMLANVSFMGFGASVESAGEGDLKQAGAQTSWTW